MNILLATPLFPPDIGGPSTHAKWASEELRKLGFFVQVLPFSEVKKYPKGIKHALYFFKVLRGARKADCVYVLDPVSVGLPAAVAAWILRKPLVLRVAGEYAWEQGVQRFGVTENLDQFVVSTKKFPLGVRIFKKIETSVARQAVHIVVPSKYFKTIIETWGIAPEKITVVYSTLQPLAVPTKAEACRKLNATYPLLVSAGRLVPWKGFPVLLKVFAYLHKEYADAKLIIVGGGPDMLQLQRLAQDLRLSDSVMFEGNLSHADVGLRVRAADVFVLNTKYEGLSHQLIEAMQIGTPIVTTAVGGNIELITNGVSGLLVQPDDEATLAASIHKILSSQALSDKLIAGAQESLTRFTPEASLASLAAVFNSIQK